MSLLSKGTLWRSYHSLTGVKASPNADGRARAMGHSAGPVSAMETTAGVYRSSGTVAKRDLAPQPQQEAQDRSLQTKFDAFRFQRTLTNLTGVERQCRKEASPGHKNSYTVDSRRFSRTNSKRPRSSPCCSSTPQPVSSMSVEAELIRAQTVSTMPSHQCRSRGCCTSRLRALCVLLSTKRGGTVAKSRHICLPVEANKGRLQAGARVKGLSGTASYDITSKHGRPNVGIFLLIYWRNLRDHDRRCRVVLKHQTRAPRIERSWCC